MRPIFILYTAPPWRQKNNHNSSFTQDSMLALNGEDSGSGTEINLIFLIISIVVSLNPVSNFQYWIIWLQTVNRTPTWKPQRISYIVMCTKCLMIRRPVIFSRNLLENLKSRRKMEVLTLTERRDASLPFECLNQECDWRHQKGEGKNQSLFDGMASCCVIALIVPLYVALPFA